MRYSFSRFFKSSKAYRGTTLPIQKPRLLGLELLESRITPSFANINTIAQSLRLAEDALPQVPGLDSSVGQMAPDRLSDLLGLNAYGNGASTWSQFDTTYPNPTVANLQTVASAIVSGSPYSSTITPTFGTTSTPGNALVSSTTFPAYGNLPDLKLGQYSGFTVQAWFNSTNIGSSWQRVIDLGNGAPSNNIIVGVTSSKLFMGTSNGGSSYNFTTGSTLASNTWYHVSAVFNGATGSLYLNGALAGSYASMPQTQNVARTNNYWGKSNWSGDPVWQGQQDELRIWNRALTATEISANYNITYGTPQSGLLLNYKADETSGTTLNDSSGNGQNGNMVFTNSATYPSSSTIHTSGQSGSTGAVYIRTDYTYSTTKLPTHATVYSNKSGSNVTPMLFKVSGSGSSATYTVVAYSATFQPPSGGASTYGLDFGSAITSGNTYVVGFSDRLVSNGTTTSVNTGCIGLLQGGTGSQGWVQTTNQTTTQGTINTVYSSASWFVTTSDYNFQVVTDIFHPVSAATLYPENGVQIQLSETGTYNSVFSTGGLDAGLRFNPTSATTLPISVTGVLNLALELNGSVLQTGVRAGWTATAALTNLNLGIGLGYLDSSIKGGSYNLNTSINVDLKDPVTNLTVNGLSGGAVGNSTDFTLANANQFVQSSGSITVSATMPFTGQVGGQAFTSTPTVTLPQQTNISTLNYQAPLWNLTGFGDYLALAQLDAQGLLNSGLNNGAGSLGSLGQTSWQDVPFSTTNVGQSYDWSNGINNTAQRLTQNVLAIDGKARIQGRIPINNYGATFTIVRGSLTNTVTLSGNLSTDQPAVMTGSLQVASGIAYSLNQKLAGTGIGCREQPGHPGYLEFYAIDPAITGFTMDASNTNVNGQSGANGLQKLGFFAEQNSSLAVQNGSFEGPLANDVSGTYSVNPSGAQWTFTSESGLAQNGSPWFSPNAPDGVQGAFIQDGGSFSQTLVDVDPGNYQVSFFAVGRAGYSAENVQVVVDGSTVYSLSAASMNTTSWQQFTTPAFALSSGNHTLTFQGVYPGSGDLDFAIDNVQLFTQTLTAEQATYPTFTSLQGMLDTLNQPNLIGPAATPAPLPGTDTATGAVYINGVGGPSFTAATIPTAIQFVATTAPTSVGNYITPLLFSVSGTGSTATYTLVAAAKSISVNRAGLQTASLLFPAFTPSSTASFVLGYSDRNMSVSTGTLSTTSSSTGNIGMDYASNNGTWLTYSPSSNFLLTNTFGVSGTSFTQVATQRSYAFSAFQGLAQAGSGSVSRPNTDTSSANSYIYTGASYTTSFVPTRIRFYANAAGTITPMLFSYTSGGTYQVAAVGSPIIVSSTQLGMVDTGVYFPTLGSLVTGTTYLFGYKNSATGVVAVQNGASTTGNWLYTATGLSGVGNSATFATAGIYSLDIIASQTAGSAAISRASLDTATGQAYINPAQTYLNPAVSGFGGNGAGWTLAKNASGPATVANDVLTLTLASMSSIFNGYWNNTPLNGLASAPWTTSFTFNDTTGTLTDGGSFIIQTQGTSALGNAWYGSGINPSVAFSWNLYNNTAGGTRIGVNTGGTLSFSDTPGSVNMGLNSPTNVVLSYDGVGNITVSLTQGANTFTKTYAANLSGLDSNAFIGFAGGQGGALATTQISNFRFATEAPVLPSAMQVYATVPSTGSGWITPMLFQVGGTSGAQTYTVAAAATSVEITATGSTLLPVEFDPTVMSTLNRGGTFVMGFSHRQVDIATGGSFSTLSTTAGIVQYAGSGGSWLATGSLSPTGLVLGQSFASSALTGGRIYSVTFLTDATQYEDYSSLASVQYNGGQQVYVSYADINESSTDLNITADAINQASIPNVENLALSGAEDVEVAIAATRQFTLMLDASVITSGASAGNTQLQANADPVTTGVLTSIAVQPGTQPFGVDGFLSSIIGVTPSTQVFTTAPIISISDKVTPGKALSSSTALPAYGNLPDLKLGQYSGFTVQAWFNSTNIGSDWQRIIDLGNGAGSNNIVVGVTGSQLFMGTFNGTTGYNYIAGPILASNTWNHVSAVFNGTTSSLYLNGILVGTQAGMPQTQNVARTNNYWGKSNWSGDPVWQGQQDELRFWNRVLTASEISANYNTVVIPYPGSGLIGQYHADETSGTTLTDSSGNNKNATLTNSSGRSLSTAPLISKGYGATALANLDPSTGKLASITLTNSGSGYVNPFVKFDDANTAKAVATMTTAGTVKGITLTRGGELLFRSSRGHPC